MKAVFHLFKSTGDNAAMFAGYSDSSPTKFVSLLKDIDMNKFFTGRDTGTATDTATDTGTGTGTAANPIVIDDDADTGTGTDTGRGRGRGTGMYEDIFRPRGTGMGTGSEYVSYADINNATNA